jgi:hypothetical protein
MVACGFDHLIKSRVANTEDYRAFLGNVLLSFP